MILTDREWLRFVTFALVAGGILGASYTGALAVVGRPPVHAITGGILASGVLGVVVHLVMRRLLDRATAAVPAAAEDETPGVDP